MVLQWFRGKSAPASSDELKIADDERIYAIGDIHGRADLLRGLLAKISDDIDARRDGRSPRLIFLGDYVDRGDHSRDVLEILCSLQQDVGASAVFLRGNHEAAMLRFLEDPEQGVDWLGWGGLQTIASFGVQPPSKPYQPEDLKVVARELAGEMGTLRAFLEATTLIERSCDYVFAHAGIDPSKPPEEQSSNALLWGHPEFLSARSLDGIRVVHGHYDGYEPEIHAHRIGLDTGAYYSGRLTAIRLDSEEQLIAVDVFDLD